MQTSLHCSGCQSCKRSPPFVCLAPDISEVVVQHQHLSIDYCDIFKLLWKTHVHTSRSTSHDYTPLLQYRTLRKVVNQVCAIKKQIIHQLFLTNLAINDCLQLQFAWVFNRISCNKTRTHGCEGIEPLREAPLRYTASQVWVTLELTRRDIVTCRISTYIIQSVFLRNILSILANDYALRKTLDTLPSISGF